MGATPPAFNPSQPRSSNKLWLWLLLGVAFLCVLCAIGGYFLFRSMLGMGMGLVSCGMTGELTQKAVLAYSLDHDGAFPPAATWQDDIRPYYDRIYAKFREQVRDMPDMFKFEVAAPGQPLECDLGSGRKSYFIYNSLVAGKNVDEFPNPHSTLLVYESMKGGYNASGDPAERGADGDGPTMMGEKRQWFDFYIQGSSGEMGDSTNEEMDFDIKPEDGLPPGTSNSAGS